MNAMYPLNPPGESAPILDVRHLSIAIGGGQSRFDAVNDLTFSVRPGKTLAIVGESGCGKSLTALSLMRLLPDNVSISGGEISIGDQDLVKLSGRGMEKLRGSAISMIFQDPMTSLNPLVRIGRQISEAIRIHRGISASQARERALELLELVGVSDAPRRLDQFPHELSGGMRQRVMIASAMAGEPKVIVADEPTTALDVTVQSQILALLKNLQRQTSMALVLITHDFGVVAQMADEVAVMYAGRIVEYGNAIEVFNDPLHPYTRGLLSCSRQGLCKSERVKAGMGLEQIPGTVIPLIARGKGCNFADRCSHATDICRSHDPHQSCSPTDHRMVECWHVHDASGTPGKVAHQ